MSQAGQENSRLLVLMFTDIAGSVGFKARHGARAYAEAIARHDGAFRGVVASFEGARIIQDTGDGFFASFRTVHDAVNAALLFQWALASESWSGEALRVRVGINVGQVLVLEDGRGAETKLVGTASDMTARVMGLAEGARS